MFAPHACATMMHPMWQADLHGVAKIVMDYLDVHHSTVAHEGQESDQRYMAESFACSTRPPGY